MMLPEPASGFLWADEAWGPVLRCAPLAAVAEHFFTTRHLSLEGCGPEVADGWRRLAERMAVDPEAVVRLKQVHGSQVIVLRRGERHVVNGQPADILVSDDSAIALSVRAADCVPLLVADARTGAVAAAHAGWRGLAAGVPRVVIEALQREFGSRPADLVAAIGPSIGPCCYTVGADVRWAFEDHRHVRGDLERWFLKPAPPAHVPERPHEPRQSVGDAYRLDLWTATRDQLIASGLLAERIHVACLCTAGDLTAFHSYRAEGESTGRLAGVIKACQGGPD